MPCKQLFTPSQLATLLKEKSRNSFSILYDCYAPALFTAICKIIKDRNIAEDILQDTFIKIWRKADTYNAARGTLYTWMLNIAINTCLDYLSSRHRIQRKKNMENEYEDCAMLTSSAGANHMLVKRELRFFVTGMEKRYREVIELIYLRQYTHEEAAVILGIPLGTVKTRASAALKKLRAVYKG